MPIFLILLFVASIDADAQNLGGVPQPSAAEIAEARAACDQLAGMPNAPMSVEACEAMMTGFGLVHVPPAIVLFLKGQRGEGKP